MGLQALAAKKREEKGLMNKAGKLSIGDDDLGSDLFGGVGPKRKADSDDDDDLNCWY